MSPRPAAAGTSKAFPNVPVVTAEQARRLLMGAQGLLADPERPATAAGLQKLIGQLGFVQIDTINVVERAHHLTLFSRLHGYSPRLLTGLLEKKRSLFEHWTHDASAIPLEWFPHWKCRFARYHSRIRRNAWWKTRLGENPDELLEGVLNRIERDGPLLSKDFEHEKSANHKPAEDGWWGWKPQKAALEHLWRTGQLSVLKRINFQKVYDLTHRVFPDHHALDMPDEREHIDWACRTALDRLGIATPAELAGFWNAIDLASARRWCLANAESGEIEPVLAGSADGAKPRPAFARRDWRAVLRRLPEAPGRLRLLSPFDPVIRDRRRAQRLFSFDYTFEAFTPEAKRAYGYYVLPMLKGERLVGRINPKHHRDRGTLEIKGIWWEKSLKPARADRAALDEAIARLAAFIGAGRIEMPAV